MMSQFLPPISPSTFRMWPRGRPRPLALLFILGFLAPGLSRGQTIAPASRTLAGIDVLEAENFRPLAGKRIGLITNQTGRDRSGKSTIDLLAHAPGVKLLVLFSPEHGIRGTEDEKVPSSTDAQTGLPVYSLYGDTTRPTDQMLDGLDVLVFDMQDAGVRFYTYITTMGYAMEAAARRHIEFYVLDRPDPLGGERVEGPVLDRDKTSFVGYFPMPVRMGMTLGEMARMFNAENHLGCDLHVIGMKNWSRAEWFDQTGLPWVNPSHNLRSFTAELLYPGIEILQEGGISVGRGTDRPFEQFGAPWIHAGDLVAELKSRGARGVEFSPTRFTPDSGLYAGQLCEGAELAITDRNALDPMRMGLEIASALQKLYPDHFDVAKMIFLVGNVEAIARLRRGDPPEEIIAGWKRDLDAFRLIRAKYLLYK
ncbi:MAG: exo-beta-N-acetylmuramidase NamZ domain-containing protein [Candidatus Acidiferrales bacterium]